MMNKKDRLISWKNLINQERQLENKRLGWNFRFLVFVVFTCFLYSEENEFYTPYQASYEIQKSVFAVVFYCMNFVVSMRISSRKIFRFVIRSVMVSMFLGTENSLEFLVLETGIPIFNILCPIRECFLIEINDFLY